jgi:hypothetical protein
MTQILPADAPQTQSFSEGSYGAGIYGDGPYGGSSYGALTGSPVKLMLVGGPLDGNVQIVLNVPTYPGATLTFNLPNYQTFDVNGSPVSYGLAVTYVFNNEGPPPTSTDTWVTSWYFDFVYEAFVPPGAPITPPGIPPVLPLTIWMAAGTGLTVTANDPGPGVLMYDTQGDLEVEGNVTSYGWASVSMSAVTTMPVETVDWSDYATMMSASTGLTVTVSPPFLNQGMFGYGTFGQGTFGGAAPVEGDFGYANFGTNDFGG